MLVQGTGFDFEKDYNWAGLIASLRPNGQPWLDLYARQGEALGWIRESLVLMRRRELAPGLDLLERARARWEPLLATSPGVFHVLGRFYHGALAYYEYCVEHFERADQVLGDALVSIQQAVEAEPCLLPFAAVSLDVPLKQAQIARARCRWGEMRDRLEEVREIVMDRRPMLVLGDGNPIYHRTLAAPFLAGPPGDGTREALRYLTDESLRLRSFEQSVEILYSLPHLLIPYP
jgi:hypothetical protein